MKIFIKPPLFKSYCIMETAFFFLSESGIITSCQVFPSLMADHENSVFPECTSSWIFVVQPLKDDFC